MKNTEINLEVGFFHGLWIRYCVSHITSPMYSSFFRLWVLFFVGQFIFDPANPIGLLLLLGFMIASHIIMNILVIDKVKWLSSKFRELEKAPELEPPE